MNTYHPQFRIYKQVLLLLAIGISGFSLPAQKVSFRLLQINDIYETGPLSGGKEGGPARVAAYRKKLEKQNIPLRTVLAGDFVSPSVMNDVLYKGQKIKGAQMIDVLNALGVDLVTFGNHEFDLPEAALQKRMNESEFEWISANVFQKTTEGIRPFQKERNSEIKPFLPCTTLVFENKNGQNIRVGFLGVTLQSFSPPYAEIHSFIEAAQKYYDTLKIRDHADIVIALTHLNIEEDRALAEAVPGIKLIIGGHEHQNHFEKVGTVSIAKADANVRSVYLHNFSVKKNKSGLIKNIRFKPQLVKITNKMPDDPHTAAVAQKWTDIAYAAFREQGFEPEQKVASLSTPLDGLEASVRNFPTNLGTMIAAAYQWNAPGAVAGLLNSGSIRIDDHIQGEINEYDVLRILPFGGQVVSVDMKGSLLMRLLQDGFKNKGSGGFLQTSGIVIREGIGFIVGADAKAKEIQPEEYYLIAMSDFLLTGKEKNMDYLTPENPEIRQVNRPDPADTALPGRDVRLALIAYLRNIEGK